MTQTITPIILSPQIAARAAFVKSHAEQHPQVAAHVDALLQDLTCAHDATVVMTLIHKLQRCYYVAKLDLFDTPEVVEAIERADFPLWSLYTALPVSAAQQQHLAKLMYEGDIYRRAPILLNLGDYSRGIAELVLQRCVAEGDETDVYISDPLFQRRLLTHCTEDKATQLGQIMLEHYAPMERTINLRIEQVQQVFPDKPVPQAIQKAYNEPLKALAALSRSKFYTVTCLPTPKDAELDQISYPDYIDLFFRMCSVDWAQVDAAHQVLIAQLNVGSVLRFTNSDGTDVSVGIKDFTFCNSLVAKNVPGSEVFSGVEINSVNGVAVGKGRYLFNGKLMENITLRFEQGRVVEYTAETGQNVLAEMIETDEGSHYIGEIGIGTNPVLRTHLVNGLLVEKIGGSFHLALGNCYKFTDYMGTPVNVDNGNNSAIHEDITFMLYGKQGRIYLDGEMIMDDGRFLDPRLSVLNGAN